MRANELIKAGDILFEVDPQRLTINRADVVEVMDGYGSVSRVSKVSSLHQRFKALIRIALDKFPTEYNGILYFKTEEDAEKFVKTQIGL